MIRLFLPVVPLSASCRIFSSPDQTCLLLGFALRALCVPPPPLVFPAALRLVLSQAALILFYRVKTTFYGFYTNVENISENSSKSIPGKYPTEIPQNHFV
jgi:hypothetical protein